MILQKMNDLSKALLDYKKSLSLNPNHIDARWALIEYYLQVPALFGGSEKNAQRYADELIKLSPVDGYLSKGRIDEYFEREVLLFQSIYTNSGL